MTPERLQRITEVVSNRQLDLTVVLENVHDPHNIAAVLRSCDSVGIGEIYGLYTDPTIDLDHFKMGKKSSSGARKWVDVYLFDDPEKCFSAIKTKYQRIIATHLGEGDAVDLYDVDFTGSLALLFGNEHEGLSEVALDYADQNFVIPQAGMVRSLNISVACAVTLYEAMRQRRKKGLYDNHSATLPSSHKDLLNEYCRRHEEKYKGSTIRRLE